jgi:hypothetical protein
MLLWIHSWTKAGKRLYGYTDGHDIHLARAGGLFLCAPEFPATKRVCQSFEALNSITQDAFRHR